MGLFNENDKKKNSENEQDIVTDGWKAIETTFAKLYPGQENPLHYGVLLSYRLGGNDPLDGISIYEGNGFYHFVTYGFPDLYEKESKNEWSGFGIELTLKLKRADKIDDNELRCAAGNLQSLARYVFESGKVFQPNEYIYTGQTNGIDFNHTSKLTGFITVLDEAGEIETPNGKVMFVQLIGATDSELCSIKDKKSTVADLLEKLPTELTDLERESLVLSSNYAVRSE